MNYVQAMYLYDRYALEIIRGQHKSISSCKWSGNRQKCVEASIITKYSSPGRAVEALILPCIPYGQGLPTPLSYVGINMIDGYEILVLENSQGNT